VSDAEANVLPNRRLQSIPEVSLQCSAYSDVPLLSRFLTRSDDRPINTRVMAKLHVLQARDERKHVAES
jgi:hypothetical protein